jgi:hypothetical protein
MQSLFDDSQLFFRIAFISDTANRRLADLSRALCILKLDRFDEMGNLSAPSVNQSINR